MSADHDKGRGTRVIVFVFGLLVAGIGFLADWLTGQPVGLGPNQLAVVGAGLLCCCFAVWARIPSAFRGVALVGAALLASLLTAEALVRLSGIDLTGERAAFKATPIWFQQPTEAVGDVFFRRPGPAQWTGRVLTEHLERRAGIVDAYPNETVSTFSYDSLGFRNPTDLVDWEVVVVGDSFVELGHLPFQELYTTRLGARLGHRVKNLGVSGTGPLTYNFYLREYGRSPSTVDAVFVFYEGNDVEDLESELNALQRRRSTGKRDHREIPNGSSLFRALVKWRAALRPPSVVPEGFLRTVGQSVSIGELPPTPADLDAARVRRLGTAIAEWSATARDLELRPWIVFMPANRRVYHDYLEFADTQPGDVREWQPSDLPQIIGDLAAANEARFIDLTPALIDQTRQGKLPYNAVWDTHLNRLGSQVVSELVGEKMSAR